MLSLLNFRNYKLEYAIEYPEAIKQYEMTTKTSLNRDFEGWFCHNDFQSIYIILSKIFNALYDISLSVEMTFNPNWYIVDGKIDQEADISLGEGFDFLKSHYNAEDYALLEGEVYQSLNFLHKVMNELSPVVSFLQRRDTKTALILLRALFSLDLRFYFSNESKPKFSELIDTHSNKEPYLLKFFDVLLQKNSYEHIFRASGFGFYVGNKKIKFDFRPSIQYPKKTVSIDNIYGFGSLIHGLMPKYHHNAFPQPLIPGMRKYGDNEFSVLNSILSIVSLELLFMATDQIEKSFHIEKTEAGVPLSKILTQIMQEGSDPSKRQFPEHSFHQNIMTLRANLWWFFIFRDKIKHHYENVIKQFIFHLEEKGNYNPVTHLIY